ncbi:hypothetical protein Bbelb_209830 [Branchiostoma belcheri]|nr:hypothetical protein Bbelb_209830 [Branchiostoma belcheri]
MSVAMPVNSERLTVARRFSPRPVGQSPLPEVTTGHIRYPGGEFNLVSLVERSRASVNVWHTTATVQYHPTPVCVAHTCAANCLNVLGEGMSKDSCALCPWCGEKTDDQ